jgi:hypothetical protein
MVEFRKFGSLFINPMDLDSFPFEYFLQNHEFQFGVLHQQMTTKGFHDLSLSHQLM